MANAVELGVAYLSLVVESKGVPAQVQRALSGVPAEGRRAGAALGRSMSDAAASAAQFDRLQRNAGAAQLKAAAATNTLAQASARASKAGAGLAAGYTRATSGANLMGAAQVRAQASMAGLARGQAAAAAAASVYAQAQGKTASSLGSMTAAQAGLARAFSSDAAVKTAAANATTRFVTASRQAPSALSSVGAALGRVGVDMTRVTTQAAAGQQALAALGGGAVTGRLREVGSEIKANLGVGLAAGIAAAGASSVNLEKTFSQTMRQVKAAAQVPQADMARLNDLAVKLGMDTSFSAGEAASAMLELAKAGLAPATIEAGALAGTLTLAEASGDGLAESAGAIGNALNMFNMEGSKAAEVAAAFAGGANASTAEVRDLTLGLAQVGPGAAAAGMSIQEVVGTLSAFNNAGLSGSDAGTSLKTMLTSLVPSSETASNAMAALGLYSEDTSAQMAFLAENGIKVKNSSKEITNGFLALAERTAGAGASTEDLSRTYAELRRQAGGITNAFFDANGQMKSATEIAQILQDSTKNLSDEERVYALNKVFGSDASRAANVLAKEGAAGLAKYIDATKDANAAQEMANARMEGTAGALERLSGAWETVRLNVGTALAPFVVLLSDALGAAIELLSGPLTAMVPVVVAAAAAWAGYAATMKIAAAASLLGHLWTMKLAIAQAFLAKAMLLNPIGLAVAALAALAVGLTYAWNNSETFRRVVTGAFDAVRGAVAALWERVRPVFEGMRGILAGTLLPAVRDFGSAVAERFGQARDAVSGFGKQIGSALAPVVGVFRTVAAAIGRVFGAAWLATMRQAVAGVVGVFTGLVDAVSGVFRLLAAVVRGDWQGVWNGLVQITGGLVGAVLGAVRTAFAPLAAVLSAVAEPAAAMFTRMWAGIAATATNAWNAVVGAVRTAWGVLSPIFNTIANVVGTVLAAAWHALRLAVVVVAGAIILAVEGLWAVAKVVFAGIVTAITRVVIPAWNAMSAAVNVVWTFLRDRVFTPLRDWLVTTLVAAFNTYAAAATRVWNGVRAIVGAVWSWLNTNVFSPLRTWLTNHLVAALTFYGSAAARVWEAVRSAISAAWSWINSRVFTPLKSWLDSTLTRALTTLQSVASTVWSAVTRTIDSAWQRVSRVFNSLRSGLQGVWDFFGTAVNGIGRTWDGIRSKVETPVRFVVNDVIRDKLVGAWNRVAGMLKLPTFNFPGMAVGGAVGASVRSFGGIRAMYAGGTVPGWSPNDTADNIPAMLTAAEFVVRRRAARRMKREHPGALDYINRTGQLPRAYRHGGEVFDSERPGPRMGARTYPITGPAPKDQGVWRQMVTWLKRNIPGARVTSAYRRTLTANKKISNHARGLAVDIVGSGRTTMMEIFNKILAAQGSRSIELIHSQAGGRQVLRGRPYFYTGTARANHWDHVHWSLPSMDPSIPADFSGVGGGGFMPNPRALAAKAIVNPLFDGARKLIDGIAGRFGQSAWIDIVKAGAKVPVDQLSTWVLKRIDETFPAQLAPGPSDNSASQAQRVEAGPVRSVVQKLAAQRGWGSGPQWDALQWIIGRESSWNPNAQNPKSTAYGLFQFLNGTWAGTGYRKTNDPQVQTMAGLKYIASRYGTPLAAQAFWRRNGWYGEGGEVGDSAKLFDGGGLLEYGDIALHNTRKPDRVLTERQWQAVERHLPTTAGGVGGGQGPNITINGIKHDSVDDFARALDYALTRARNVGRYALVGG